ncbi:MULTISPECIES: phage holin family protein [Dyadobacter]|jgi:putative membrane protein|uniref:Phage holin family protein n=1 Tax=Dyadobacter chenhuakuii TaxID=2909339 RepID=A0A9X1U2A9_9BACT|nr:MULTISPECIES: phage holin family protein [Dyadobacter]MCE7069149.1 phage holin family protein [Dyadobacter sp. CY327]MCF2495321.1 phage holin family protein [Dyadobacter chenhuakuii]MCF2500366.1 phage holin family protein [Dyadobacter chenhuakuii]MCF2516097.1 phage holin family protein [Dyadobacter sp. CY351]USJ29361.1 phage holin family protein [Dyadobacter chenhuakuii]
MKLIIRLLISTLAILLAAKLIPGVVVASTTTAIIVAIVLGILNTFLKPVLQILALPITIMTLGLFYFVVNVFIIYLATYLVSGFSIDGFIPALLFGFVVSIISGILGMFLD